MRLKQFDTTHPIYGVSGTFGTVQIAAHDQAVVLQTVGRNYDTTGILRVDTAVVRLPVRDAIRLHALLADAIVEAEERHDSRQTALWSSATYDQRSA